MSERRQYIKQEVQWDPLIVKLYVSVCVLFSISFVIAVLSQIFILPSAIELTFTTLYFSTGPLLAIMFLGKYSELRRAGRDFDTYSAPAKRLGLEIGQLKAAARFLGNELTDERLGSWNSDQLEAAIRSRIFTNAYHDLQWSEHKRHMETIDKGHTRRFDLLSPDGAEWMELTAQDAAHFYLEMLPEIYAP